MSKFNLKSWLIGFVLGLSGEPLPIGIKPPVAYLYSGVRLPALPEWDKKTYPYVFIARSWLGSYIALVTQTPSWIYIGNSGEVIDWNVPALRVYYDASTGTWGELQEELSDFNIALHSDFFVWSNHDIKKDGSVRVIASDPIPVYE